MTLFSFSTTSPRTATSPPPWNFLSSASQFRLQPPCSSSCFLIERRKGHATTLRLAVCSAASKQQQSGGPVKKKPPPSSKKRNNKQQKQQINKKGGFNLDDDDFDDDDVTENNGQQERYQPPPIPNPPAGFVVDEQGRVLLVSDKRIATIVDSTNNFPLECIIRRVFTSSRGDECMLLCPVDMPVQILKSTDVEGWSAVSDDEVEAILPNAAYALAKIHIHLVHSGFCYTARGGFCYTEDDIFEFRPDDGEDVDGLPTEGIEITCFHLDGSHYMIYTPSDPLLFVAVKDQNGQLQIVDDDLLEDPAVISAIDEETEFNALVEEESALLESLLGKR